MFPPTTVAAVRRPNWRKYPLRDAERSTLYKDGAAFDPGLVYRHIGRDRPVDQFAAAHIELREMQRAFDDMAVEPAARQRRIPMSANVADRVENAADIGQQHPLAVDRDAFHAARRDVRDAGDRDEVFRHIPHL